MSNKIFNPEDETQHFGGECTPEDRKKLDEHFAKKHATKAKIKAKQKAHTPSLLKKIFG
jgi:hypothetical protein